MTIKPISASAQPAVDTANRHAREGVADKNKKEKSAPSHGKPPERTPSDRNDRHATGGGAKEAKERKPDDSKNGHSNGGKHDGEGGNARAKASHGGAPRDAHANASASQAHGKAPANQAVAEGRACAPGDAEKHTARLSDQQVAQRVATLKWEDLPREKQQELAQFREFKDFATAARAAQGPEGDMRKVNAQVVVRKMTQHLVDELVQRHRLPPQANLFSDIGEGAQRLFGGAPAAEHAKSTEHYAALATQVALSGSASPADAAQERADAAELKRAGFIGVDLGSNTVNPVGDASQTYERLQAMVDAGAARNLGEADGGEALVIDSQAHLSDKNAPIAQVANTAQGAAALFAVTQGYGQVPAQASPEFRAEHDRLRHDAQIQGAIQLGATLWSLLSMPRGSAARSRKPSSGGNVEVAMPNGKLPTTRVPAAADNVPNRPTTSPLTQKEVAQARDAVILPKLDTKQPGAIRGPDGKVEGIVPHMPGRGTPPAQPVPPPDDLAAASGGRRSPAPRMPGASATATAEAPAAAKLEQAAPQKLVEKPIRIEPKPQEASNRTKPAPIQNVSSTPPNPNMPTTWSPIYDRLSLDEALVLRPSTQAGKGTQFDGIEFNGRSLVDFSGPRPPRYAREYKETLGNYLHQRYTTHLHHPQVKAEFDRLRLSHPQALENAFGISPNLPIDRQYAQYAGNWFQRDIDNVMFDYRMQQANPRQQAIRTGSGRDILQMQTADFIKEKPLAAFAGLAALVGAADLVRRNFQSGPGANNLNNEQERGRWAANHVNYLASPEYQQWVTQNRDYLQEHGLLETRNTGPGGQPVEVLRADVFGWMREQQARRPQNLGARLIDSPAWIADNVGNSWNRLTSGVDHRARQRELIDSLTASVNGFNAAQARDPTRDNGGFQLWEEAATSGALKQSTLSRVKALHDQKLIDETSGALKTEFLGDANARALYRSAVNQFYMDQAGRKTATYLPWSVDVQRGILQENAVTDEIRSLVTAGNDTGLSGLTTLRNANDISRGWINQLFDRASALARQQHDITDAAAGGATLKNARETNEVLRGVEQRTADIVRTTQPIVAPRNLRGSSREQLEAMRSGIDAKIGEINAQIGAIQGELARRPDEDTTKRLNSQITSLNDLRLRLDQQRVSVDQATTGLASLAQSEQTAVEQTRSTWLGRLSDRNTSYAQWFQRHGADQLTTEYVNTVVTAEPKRTEGESGEQYIRRLGEYYSQAQVAGTDSETFRAFLRERVLPGDDWPEESYIKVEARRLLGIQGQGAPYRTPDPTQPFNR